MTKSLRFLWTNSSYVYIFFAPFLLLSYVNQNYLKAITPPRLTYKSYFYWLLRNSRTLPLILIAPLKHVSKIWLYNNSWVFDKPLLSFYFSKGISHLFSKTSITWKPILESAYNRGLEYWAYRSVLECFPNANFNGYYQPKIASNPWFNQIYLENNYIGVAFFNKYFRTVLIYHLFLVIKPWQIWRTHFKFSYGLLIKNDAFHLLRFFNTQFFKQYSV